VRTIQEMPRPVDEPLPMEADAAGGIVEPTTSPLAGTGPVEAWPSATVTHDAGTAGDGGVAAPAE
jgi:hypothetical protein